MPRSWPRSWKEGKPLTRIVNLVKTAGLHCGGRAVFKPKERSYLRAMLSRRQLQGFVGPRPLLSTFREHGVNWRLERDEQNARSGVSAARLVLGFGRAICVRTGPENGRLLPLVGDMKHSRHQDHVFRRGVPMQRQPVVSWNPEEYVGAAISRVAPQDSDFATLRKDGWARTPLKLRVLVCP